MSMTQQEMFGDAVILTVIAVVGYAILELPETRTRGTRALGGIILWGAGIPAVLLAAGAAFEDQAPPTIPRSGKIHYATWWSMALIAAFAVCLLIISWIARKIHKDTGGGH